MKTLTLTVDVVVEVEDNVDPIHLGVYIPTGCRPIDCRTGEKKGKLVNYETTGFIEEEKVGLGEFEDKPETD